MKCHECGKNMKGGFGVGERPYSKFRCADCTIRENENAQNAWALKKIVEIIDEPIMAGCRNYKAQTMQIWEKTQRIKTLAKLVLETK